MARLTLTLPEAERDALRALAEREFREPRMQAALLLREALERRGLLPVAEPAIKTAGLAQPPEAAHEN